MERLRSIVLSLLSQVENHVTTQGSAQHFFPGAG